MKVSLNVGVQILLLLLSQTMLVASPQSAPRKLQVRAIRVQESVSVDGKLSEPFWKDEYAISDFVQLNPKEGAAPTEKTLVDVIYDNDAIYIGVRMYDSNPKLITARLGRKDVDLTADKFTVYIDPYHDRRTGYYFAVNAAGTQYDGTLYNDSWDDNSWDGVWEGRAHIDEKGWTAEFRIPYSQLRFQTRDQYVWGVNFKRTISRKNEDVYLVYTPKNESGFVSRFPDLVGIEKITPPKRIEIMPYITSKSELTHPDSGDPFHDGSSHHPGVGSDFKLGLGTNLTLDATANPDFGQVEVDPAVINLSDVETFFQEKRPFFIEGSSIFEFGRGGASDYWSFNFSEPLLFYSRRIGRTPQGSLPDNEFADVPAGTQILTAAKITGKIGNGWNVGTLHAFTDREMATISNLGEISKTEVEPFAYYEVSRAQKEFNEGKQGLGFITTLSGRRFDDQQLRDQINDHSLVFGFDGWTFLDSNKTWVISGSESFTRVSGTAARITELQQDPRHYFQRPDAGYVEVDPNATSLSGSMGRLNFVKQKGDWIFNSALGYISPGFDSNDLGFLWRADVINGHLAGGYQWTKPKNWYRRVQLIGAVFRSLDFDLNTTWAGMWHRGQFEFPNYYNLTYSVAWNPEETLNNTRTRGGPSTLNLPGYEANIDVQSDSRKKWVFGGGGNYYEADSSHYRAVYGSVEWKPVANVSVSAAPTFEIDRTPAQWIDTFADPLATQTYGSRYVFAYLNNQTFSANLRLNWTFSPKLSLQLFAQPLVSAGDYRDYKELARPGSYDFNFYNPAYSSLTGDTFVIDPDGPGPATSISFANPNFNFRSLRGNAILRWEYRPGSTLFFVWTQSRSEQEQFGDFQFSHSFGNLWKAKADNIFLIKFSYYWNL